MIVYYSKNGAMPVAMVPFRPFRDDEDLAMCAVLQIHGTDACLEGSTCPYPGGVFRRMQETIDYLVKKQANA